MGDIKNLQQGKYILWGGSTSSYSGKLRTYLIKKDIDYVEIHPSHPYFKSEIVPQIGHFTVPVLQKPGGDIIADSTEAIEFLETLYPDLPAIPENKIMAAITQIIHSFGSEGNFKAMMYYRWNTTYDNRCFVIEEFARTVFQKEDRDPAMLDEFSKTFRQWPYIMGVRNSHGIDSAIEKSSHHLYQILNEHFQEYPYILGGLPCLADYGLFMGLFPHQGRDPATSSDLKLKFPTLFRWMEIMQRKVILDPDLYHVPQTFFTPEDIPQTVKNLLALIFDDFGPEILATANAYHEWLMLENHPAGTIISAAGEKQNHQRLGEITHVQRGIEITREAFLDSLTHHQRLVAVIDSMNPQERDAFENLMSETGGKELSELRLKRPMGRENYAYVVK